MVKRLRKVRSIRRKFRKMIERAPMGQHREAIILEHLSSLKKAGKLSEAGRKRLSSKKREARAKYREFKQKLERYHAGVMTPNELKAFAPRARTYAARKRRYWIAHPRCVKWAPRVCERRERVPAS